MNFNYDLIILAIIVLLIVYYFINRQINLNIRKKTIENMKNIKEKMEQDKINGTFDNINEWSYQRFCNFFDSTELKDELFNEKIATIYDLIVNKKITNLSEIAELSNCTDDELILKIMYLKNKRKLGDLYIDKGDGVIRECSIEDKMLLDKYSKFIYNYHDQPYEIARKLPNATINNIDKLANQVLEELSYLDDKYLINGINIDKVDKKIIYYTIEKHKKEKDYISINCSKCGALVDVPRGGKSRCSYCKNIVEDKNEK